ncbi:hypothetical protein FJT64_013171 [Amphibalanus amphitrite]|uniref:Uncharacterized protein n=1 Tax=Amphibalanus amphitrite TaxID=1232801 RepID=A0A6A4VA88_AMPAM|nr:hypothetical protein FJT64_013171 [Amphibalanus amphitrite]
MYLTRHHLWCIRQIDFLDPSLDDPMTCMALHRHTIESPDKAGKLTPFQMFLERHLNPAVLKELCAKLNRHAKQRKSDRRFRDWTDTVPDELRVFILQMIYIASNHSRDERWDGPPRVPSGRTRQDPSNSTKLIEDIESEFSLRREDEGDTKSSSDQKDEQSSAHCEEPSHRPNTGRLFTSMDPCRFRQIAAAWHAFDLCEPPQRSERRRRVKNLQTVLDLLLNGPSLAVLPALLAIGSRTVRCHTPPAEGGPASSRRVDLTFVMDSRRYVYDVVISEPTRRRRRFRTTDPGVVNRIKQRLKPTTEKNMFVLMEEINNAVREIAKRKHPSFADGPSGKPKRVPVGPDHMHRYFFMDGLTVSEAERCAENDIFCMAPIPPDDPRRSEFVTLDDDMPKVSADNGRLICTPHGNRQKINFFHLRDADRPRHQLVCSAFHQLTAEDGRRAQQQVTKTQQQLREAVEQVTSRLSHGGTASGLRHYHRLFLRAVSACIQNSILARGVARDDSSEDSGVSSAKKFSAFASTKALASYCDTEYETFLSDLLDWLEATPRVKPRPPKMTREEMHDQLTADLMDSATVDGAADMRCTMLIHGTNKMSRAMTRLEESRCVGEKKRQKYGNIVVSEVEDLDLF